MGNTEGKRNGYLKVNKLTQHFILIISQNKRWEKNIERNYFFSAAKSPII